MHLPFSLYRYFGRLIAQPVPADGQVACKSARSGPHASASLRRWRPPRVSHRATLSVLMTPDGPTWRYLNDPLAAAS